MSNNINMSNNNNNNNNNRKEFLYKNEEKNSILDQGADYLKNKFKKVEHILSNIISSTSVSNTEGFEGILGPNDVMRNKINSDYSDTHNRMNKITNNIGHYNNSRKKYNDKTKEYLGDTDNFRERNYNIFINSLPNPNINDPKTSNYSSCVSTESLETSMPHDNKFNEVYPQSITIQKLENEYEDTEIKGSNFDSFEKAKQACKTWAVDSNKPRFAISKTPSTDDSGSFYRCHVGTKEQSDNSIYTKPQLAYVLVNGQSGTGPRATSGGLFANGLIGVSFPGEDMLVTPELPEYRLLDIDKSYLIENLHKNSKDLQRLNEQNTFFWGGWFRNLDTNNPPGSTTGNYIYSSRPEWLWGKHSTGRNPGSWSSANSSGYLYYFYMNPANEYFWAKINIISDDRINTVFVNNKEIRWLRGKGGNTVYYSWARIIPGLNVFEFEGYDTGGWAGIKVIVFRHGDYPQYELFHSTTTDPKFKNNWALSYTRLDYDKIMKTNVTKSRPRELYFNGYSHNDELFAPYNKCDPYTGGDINSISIQASYGRNCSNTTQKPYMTRYIMVENRKNQSDSWLQIGQIEVQGFDNGQLTNLAIKGRNGEGSVKATSTWWNRQHITNLYNNINDGNSGYLEYLNSAIDGKTAPRNFYGGGFHSGTAGNNEYWLLDLGKSYPVTKVIYYNRSDCCSHRANGMTINLYNRDSEPNLSSPRDKYFTLNGELIQEFITTGNNTGVGETSCSSHIEITPSMPSHCRDRLLSDTNTYKIVNGNNGTVDCNRYCRGNNGSSWNNEMSGWAGAKCVAGGSNHDKPCSYTQGSLTKCICKRDDSLGWA